MSERLPDREPEIVELVRSIDVRAPARLHHRIEALVAEQSDGPARQRPPLRLGLVGVVVLGVIVAIVAASVSGGGATFTLPKAVALTLRPATLAAPTENPHDATALEANVEGVAFPYWEDSFGWRSAGARTDELDGRTVETVFYEDARRQWIGYAIVGGTPAPRVGGGLVSVREGTRYRFMLEDGAGVVTWLRDGRMCVLAGRGVSHATLLSLASWQASRTLTA
jgi:hypothetical protein